MSIARQSLGRLRLAANALVRGFTASPGRQDMDSDFWRLQAQVAPFTMTSPERLMAVRDAIRYSVRAGIPGAFVECGVWKGGSAMMAALTLRQLEENRELWLYDTFEGMSEPTSVDTSIRGEAAQNALARSERRSDKPNIWCYSPLEEVRANIRRTGVSDSEVRLIRGKVEATLPDQAPDAIAVLRLDTDWYESTFHELTHLYPLLSPGGVLILDDYGHWAGARKAVDEYFATRPLFLARTDYTGRVGIKR